MSLSSRGKVSDGTDFYNKTAVVLMFEKSPIRIDCFKFTDFSEFKE